MVFFMRHYDARRGGLRGSIPVPLPYPTLSGARCLRPPPPSTAASHPSFLLALLSHPAVSGVRCPVLRLPPPSFPVLCCSPSCVLPLHSCLIRQYPGGCPHLSLLPVLYHPVISHSLSAATLHSPLSRSLLFPLPRPLLLLSMRPPSEQLSYPTISGVCHPVFRRFPHSATPPPHHPITPSPHHPAASIFCCPVLSPPHSPSPRSLLLPALLPLRTVVLSGKSGACHAHDGKHVQSPQQRRKVWLGIVQAAPRK